MATAAADTLRALHAGLKQAALEERERFVGTFGPHCGAAPGVFEGQLDVLLKKVADSARVKALAWAYEEVQEAILDARRK